MSFECTDYKSQAPSAMAPARLLFYFAAATDAKGFIPPDPKDVARFVSTAKSRSFAS